MEEENLFNLHLICRLGETNKWLKRYYLWFIFLITNKLKQNKKKNESFRLFINGWLFLDMVKLQHCNNRKKHIILEFAGNRQNLSLPTQCQAVLLTCLCARSLCFVPSTYRSVLVSDSTLLSLSVFFHSIPSPVLSCAQYFLLLHLSTALVLIQNEKRRANNFHSEIDNKFHY